jgi:hypothetical protein
VIEDIRFLGGHVYAAAMDEGLLASADGGGTWRQVFPLAYTDAFSGHQWRIHAWEGGGAAHLLTTVSPWNGAHPNTVVRSDDGGGTFTAAGGGLPGCVPARNTMWGRSYPRALAADPADPTSLYLGMDGDPDPDDPACAGGFFRSRDGGRTWVRPRAQPGSRRVFFGLAADPSRRGRVYWGACGEGGGVYRSDDAGESWTKVFGGDAWIFNLDRWGTYLSN